MKKYDVQCPFCNGTFHETNGRFDPNKPAKGNMFETKQHVKDAGWSTFPPYDSTEYQNLVCPSCDQPYVDSMGRVVRLKEIGEIEQVVDEQTARAEFPGTQYAEVEPEPLTEPAPLTEPEPAPAPKKRQTRKKADA